jgi:N6-adenosine-specific RNA methylase IME4
MTAVRIGDIVVGERHRREMGDLQSLADSISRQGLLQPIGIDGAGQLVFGERRLRAVRDVLGWSEIEARTVNVTSLVEGEHDENEVRKDFTPSERVAIARAIEDALGKRQGKRTDRAAETSGQAELLAEPPQDFAEVRPGQETRDFAARKAGFGNRETARQAASVVDKGAPELVEAMDAGTVSVSAAADVASLPKEEQAEIVAKGEKEILAAAKEIRAAKATERRTERLEKLAEISKGNADLNTGKRYPVIYADPPWQYENPPIGASNRSIENHYPTMTLDEICALPVQSITTDDAILYLWATAPKLEECFSVINAWGFNYRTHMVWDKVKIGMGYHTRSRHELLLICTRGQMVPPAAGTQPASVYVEERGVHSAKPRFFAEMIEAFYPDLPRIELFCRSPRDGWDVWGNQSSEVTDAA